jgi:glycine oxidase
VIVVGAGVVGLSTAYFLAERGARVVVLEQEAIGWAASGTSAGMVSPFAEVDGPPTLDLLAEEGLQLHARLAAILQGETGIDVHYGPIAVLLPAFEEREAEQLRAHARSAASGLQVEWLDVAAARAAEPRLSPRALGALCAPDEAQVDSYRLSLALARAAEQRGVTIRYGRVTGLLRSGSRVRGIRLASDRLLAPRVVLAAGPWTGRMADWLGWPVPVVPLRGQLLRLRVPDPPLRACLVHGGSYLLPKRDGLTTAGTTMELAGFRPRPTQAGAAHVRRVALRLAPSLAEAAEVEHTACLRPLSQDRLPILGAVPDWEGVYLATGHGRFGILLGPISGRLMAELVLEGRASADLSAFSPARFTPAPHTRATPA